MLLCRRDDPDTAPTAGWGTARRLRRLVRLAGFRIWDRFSGLAHTPQTRTAAGSTSRRHISAAGRAPLDIKIILSANGCPQVPQPRNG
ncbi:hypothetical protein GCM10023178_06730 [Actinomadura luteofluorescens]